MSAIQQKWRLLIIANLFYFPHFLCLTGQFQYFVLQFIDEDMFGCPDQTPYQLLQTLSTLSTRRWSKSAQKLGGDNLSQTSYAKNWKSFAIMLEDAFVCRFPFSFSCFTLAMRCPKFKTSFKLMTTLWKSRNINNLKDMSYINSRF